MMPRVWRTNRGVKKAWAIFCARLAKEPSTRFFFSLGNLGTLVILGVFFCSQYLPPRSSMHLWTDHWLYLWTALLGMGIAGGFMWAVRFVSSLAMGREAMGFGDVILMAMLGAMLGWQPSVILFFIAPFMGLLLGLVIWLITGDSEIPYGPFLCAAALVTILFWEPLWEYLFWAPLSPESEYHFSFFALGPLLFLLGGICLAAMTVLLGILRVVKKMVSR